MATCIYWSRKNTNTVSNIARLYFSLSLSHSFFSFCQNNFRLENYTTSVRAATQKTKKTFQTCVVYKTIFLSSLDDVKLPLNQYLRLFTLPYCKNVSVLLKKMKSLYHTNNSKYEEKFC